MRHCLGTLLIQFTCSGQCGTFTDACEFLYLKFLGRSTIQNTPSSTALASVHSASTLDRPLQDIALRAHWRHLANAIELVHPSAHSSPQSKRQMDRFSRFAQLRQKVPIYFTMGAPIHQNCPFPWEIWTSHVTRDAFGPCEPTTQTAPRSVQPSLHR